jgi:CheY-like chemotaxis protein
VKSKVLIVDDDLESWCSLSTMLRTHDFNPVWAADGMQAIAAARLHQPQAILLDLGMSGEDGLVVLERLKSNRLLSHIPVIVVTAHDRQIAEVETRRLGAVAYLQKPIHDDALLVSLLIVLPSDGPPEDGVAQTA